MRREQTGAAAGVHDIQFMARLANAALKRSPHQSRRAVLEPEEVLVEGVCVSVEASRDIRVRGATGYVLAGRGGQQAACDRTVGLNAQPGCVERRSFVESAHQPQQGTEAGKSGGVGPDGERLLQRRKLFVRAAEFLVGRRKRKEVIGVRGILLGGTLVRCGCSLQSLQLFQHRRQIPRRLGMIRAQLERLLVRVRRVVKRTELPVDPAKTHVCLHVCGVHVDGPTQEIEGRKQPALPTAQAAETVQRLDVVRVGLQHLGVRLRRFVDGFGLVALHAPPVDLLCPDLTYSEASSTPNMRFFSSARRSRAAAASSNSRLRACSSIFFSSALISRAICFSESDSMRASSRASCAALASYTPSIRSLMRLITPLGVMALRSLYRVCLLRRRSVSPSAFLMDSVSWSA